MREDFFEFIPSSDRATGYYVITCGECGKQNRAAMTVTEGQLYKMFVERNWHIDRERRTGNRCPQCLEAAQKRGEHIKGSRILPIIEFDPRNCTIFLCSMILPLQWGVAPWTAMPMFGSRQAMPMFGSRQVTASSRYVDYLRGLSREDRIKEIKRAIIAADLVEVFVRRLSLKHAWETADANEQDDFKAWLLTPPRAPTSKLTVVPTFIEATELDDDDEPADWWKELHSGETK